MNTNTSSGTRSIARQGRSLDEMFWVELCDFLLQRGYRLRQRYQPGWIPSWVLDETKAPRKLLAEDHARGRWTHVVLDARRISDNTKVVLKRTTTKSNEIPVLSYLSHPERKNDPRNRSVPLLDVIPIPGNDDLALVVLPVLMSISHLPFRRVGEVAEAILQLFEALAYLHEHDIIHGDACLFNFMIDGSKMVPSGWHFGSEYFGEDGETHIEWNDRWSTRPNRYFLIDFGLSIKVNKDLDRWISGNWGQDRTVPEMSMTTPCDAFKVDIYQSGNILNKLIKQYSGLESFQPIANKLTAQDPNQRPSAASAVRLIRYFAAKKSYSALSRYVWRKEPYRPDFRTRIKIMYFNAQYIE